MANHVRRAPPSCDASVSAKEQLRLVEAYESPVHVFSGSPRNHVAGRLRSDANHDVDAAAMNGARRGKISVSDSLGGKVRLSENLL